MENTQSIRKLVEDIENGFSVLPEFQRDFVWELGKTLDLFDSLVKDIFIGAIIYGIPSFDITVREIDSRPRKVKGKKRKSLETTNYLKEDIEAKQKISNDAFKLILDGQQRVTSLYRALSGIDEIWFIVKNDEDITSDEVQKKKFEDRILEELLYAFDDSSDAQRISVKLSHVWDQVKKNYRESIIEKDFFHPTRYYTNYEDDPGFNSNDAFEKYLTVTDKLKDLFKAEKLLSFYLLDMSMDKFVLFFERSNSRGVQLNFIDILTAKLYIGFNLKQHINDFKSAYPKYKLNEEIIVRTIAYLVSNEQKGSTEINRSFILTKLTAENFEKHWGSITNYYKLVLDFLYQNHYIISQSWIPYENMLIPLMIFLREIGGDFHLMTQEQQKFIRYWYWASIFSQRYTGSSNEKIILDATTLSKIAHNNKITTRTYLNKLAKSQVTNEEDLFSYNKKASSVYKGVLNIINFHNKGFLDWNNTNKLSFNSQLEDHHIFPKDYIKKNYAPEDDAQDQIDLVLNRALVPKLLNIKIGNKKPSEYLSKIKEKNTNLKASLQSHLIDKEILTGSYDKNFNFFLSLRAEAIFKVIKQEILDKKEEIQKEFYSIPQVDSTKEIAIFGSYYKKRIEARFNTKTGSVFYNGKLYETPSSAANQAKIDCGAHSGITSSGWTFWKFINENDNTEEQIDVLRKISEAY
ncbi:DUF262 domain-containing protein [Microscilla marina]|uniref:GmrSD restriction endonucleases N-terminal domain-containing protein n=1 Tax=Microscilla marina ATCC 23134 TaxID=313606 RepID=A1ZKR9_MICM2|nr:DUF262 domain-containing protein [Microscilla marina]EAY28885.1 protein of unknown function [Microscilla marina ATCC 23134]